MQTRLPPFASALLAAAFACVLADSPALASDRTVILMLFDGFSPAYVEKFDTPNLNRMRVEGAFTDRMLPPFPSISLIGSFTIATGCWPKHHGIVTNKFLDPEKGLYDHSIDADWLTGCETLNVAAERQGIQTASLGFVGRFSGTKGDLASIVSPARQWVDYPDDHGRADQVIAELQKPAADRPRLILAYFKGPDAAGHFTGMDSPETKAAVETSDAVVGRVLEAVAAAEGAEDIAVLVTTDHGMKPVEQVVNIARILRRHSIPARAVSTGTTSFLYFEDKSDAVIDDALVTLSTYLELDVYRKEDAPKEWHLGTGPRVGDLIVSAKPPLFIEDIEEWPWFTHFLQYIGPDFLDSSASLKATHGYPSDTPGVEGILYGWGSGIAAGREVPSVRAVDVHPTVMRLLGAEPGEPVDGVVATGLLDGAAAEESHAAGVADSGAGER